MMVSIHSGLRAMSQAQGGRRGANATWRKAVCPESPDLSSPYLLGSHSHDTNAAINPLTQYQSLLTVSHRLLATQGNVDYIVSL